MEHLTLPHPRCISYANVRNYYDPYAYCTLDKGVAYTRGGGGGAVVTKSAAQ